MNINELLEEISNSIIENDIDNNGLVQLIECAGDYLNLRTIPNYAKEHNISYNGAKKFRQVVEIFNTKFIIDNE